MTEDRDFKVNERRVFKRYDDAREYHALLLDVIKLLGAKFDLVMHRYPKVLDVKLREATSPTYHVVVRFDLRRRPQPKD